MYTSFKSKIATYAGLATSFIAARQAATAQIIYSNPPDSTIVGVSSEYFIDLNNDGTNDIKIRIENTGPSTKGYGIVLSAARGFNNRDYLQAFDYSRCQGDFFYGYGVYPFRKNQVIKGNEKNRYADWYPISYGEVLNWDYYGATCHRWAGLNKKFVGLRMHNRNGGYNYGWLRLSVSESGRTVTVHDWALNSKAGEQILAGQTMSEDRNMISSNSLNIYSFGRQIFIKQENQPSEIKISVLNILGEEVKQVSSSADETKIDLSAFSGIYIIKVYSDAGIFSKQILLQ